MATLGEVMSRDVITIEPFDTIGHAAEKMVAEGVSAIVVSDGGRLIGIVTEIDILRHICGTDTCGDPGLDIVVSFP